MLNQQARQVLQDLITRLDTQDNRGTAAPWLHMLRVKQRCFVPECGGGGGWWGPAEDWEISRVKASNADEALKILNERYPGTDFIEDDIEQYDAIEWWEVQNAFLTQEGLERHMKLNSHNIHGEHQDYLEHAFRNPELMEVLQAIRDVLKEAP